MHWLLAVSPTVANFWHLLWILSVTHVQASAQTDNGSIVYGGNALQAFLYALQHGLNFVYLAG